MIYDASEKRIMLFGGTPGTGALADTWEWSGSNWVQLKPKTSPRPRGSHAMPYDSSRSRSVLFGGVRWPRTFYPAETWEWSGTTWARMTVATSPSARIFVGMTYDARCGRAVMFGGATNFSASAVTGDTWEFENPTAAFSTFGKGCASTARLPTIDSTTKPRLGSKFTLDIRGFLPKAQCGQLILGSSNTSWSIIPLPLGLAVLGMPNCTLSVSIDASSFFVTDSRGGFTTTFPIPPATSILGTKFYGQARAPDPACNRICVAMTNAFGAVVGY